MTLPIKLELWKQRQWMRQHSAFDMRRLLLARTLRQVEEASLCLLHGYADAEAYYAASSPLQVIECYHANGPTLYVPKGAVKLNRRQCCWTIVAALAVAAFSPYHLTFLTPISFRFISDIP